MDISELDDWLSGRPIKQGQPERADSGNQPSGQSPARVGRIYLTQGSYHHSEGTGAVSVGKERPRPLPSGGKTEPPARTRHTRGQERTETAVPNADEPTEDEQEEVSATPQLVQQRLGLAQKLNDIYTTFASTREKKRNDALRTLARDLARLGGSISACGMTGEVKEFVMTLLMLEKVLPTGESGEDLGANPTQMISDWLNGKGELTGEFDAVGGK